MAQKLPKNTLKFYIFHKNAKLGGVRGGFGKRPHFFRVFFVHPSLIEDHQKGSDENRSDPPVYIIFRVGPEWNRPSLPGEHAAHICGEIWFSQTSFDPTQILQRFGLFSYSHRSCFFSLSSSLIRYIFTGNKRRKHHLIGACDKGPGFSLRSPLLRYIAIQSIWCLQRMKLFKHFIAFTKETKSSPLLRYMLAVNNYTGT